MIPKSYTQQIKSAWDSGLDYEVLRAAAVFFVVCIAGTCACAFVPAVQTGAEHVLELLFGDSAISLEGVGNMQMNPFGIFLNNYISCGMIMLYGLIPVVMLPALQLGINAAVIGMLGVLTVRSGSSPAVYLLSLLPHGILELPALVLSAGTGFFVCSRFTARIRKKPEGAGIRQCLQLMGEIQVKILLPVLILASLIESFITPALVGALV